MRKSRATPVGAPEGEIEELPSGALSGALLAPGGKVSIAPFAPGVPVALVGSGPQPPGTLAFNSSLGGLNGMLEVISAGTLGLISFRAARITLSGAIHPVASPIRIPARRAGWARFSSLQGVTSGAMAAGGSPSLPPAARRPSNVPFAIPAESGDNWTDAGGFPLPNVAREDY